MRVSSIAATAANNSTNGNGHPQKSPALDQLRAAIEPDALAGGNQAASDAATAVLEAGEDNDGDEEGGDHDDAGQDVEFVCIGQPDIATETMDAAQVAPVIDKTAMSSVPAPAPYDPIADVEEEISEIGERIVAHSCKIVSVRVRHDLRAGGSARERRRAMAREGGRPGLPGSCRIGYWA